MKNGIPSKKGASELGSTYILGSHILIKDNEFAYSDAQIDLQGKNSTNKKGALSIKQGETLADEKGTL